jgi:cation diffusion facilitator family transporter
MQEYAALVKIATSASVISAFIIIIGKLIGWAMTDSLAILASLTDSLLDIVASIINLIAARYSLQPPDHKHRFGYGKAEDLAVFTQSSLFGISGIFLLVNAAKRMMYPEPIENNMIGIWIMAFSMGVTLILVIIQRYVIKKTNSQVVKADQLHYSVDLLSNAVVILSLFLSSKLDSDIIDPLFSIMIALYILYGAWHLLEGAFKNLMDHEFDDKEREAIFNIVLQHHKVKGLHDLKTRYSGPRPFIQFHLELDGDMSLKEAHHIAEEIEAKLLQRFTDAEITIHQDPAELYAQV